MLSQLIILAASLATITFAMPGALHPAPFNYISKNKTPRNQGKISFYATNKKRDVGGVTLCSGTDFSGNCWHGTYPLDTCVALNCFAGNTLSFRPDAGTECFLMQGQCDSEEPYMQFYPDSPNEGDLSNLPWISNATSYFCFKPINTTVTKE